MGQLVLATASGDAPAGAAEAEAAVVANVTAVAPHAPASFAS